MAKGKLAKMAKRANRAGDLKAKNWTVMLRSLRSFDVSEPHTFTPSGKSSNVFKTLVRAEETR